MARLIPFDPNQPLPLPRDLHEALLDGVPARLVGELVDHVVLSGIESALPDERSDGAPAFDPPLLLGHWIGPGQTDFTDPESHRTNSRHAANPLTGSDTSS